jgi:hypothetical protein
MTVPLLARWMLVFEEPESDVLWLAKGTPRAWLEDGQTIAVSNAPTRWGRVSFSLRSHLGDGKIGAMLDLPARPPEALVKLRLRVPAGHRIRSVQVNGKPWDQFDAPEETVTLPSQTQRRVDLTLNY